MEQQWLGFSRKLHKVSANFASRLFHCASIYWDNGVNYETVREFPEYFDALNVYRLKKKKKQQNSLGQLLGERGQRGSTLCVICSLLNFQIPL